MGLAFNLNPEFSVEVLLRSMHNVQLDFYRVIPCSISQLVQNRVNGQLLCLLPIVFFTFVVTS